jgi:hypothetical protein
MNIFLIDAVFEVTEGCLKRLLLEPFDGDEFAREELHSGRYFY